VTAKLRNLSPVVASVLLGVAALLVLVGGLFLLVMPQRHKAAQLNDEVVATQTKIVSARALANRKPAERIRVADLFKVVEAMPDDTDMTGVMLQLQTTAGEAGVKFDSIQPQAAQPGNGYQMLPIDLVFDGNYFSLTDFLFRLRKLVTVQHGKLGASGRLFTVDRVDFQPAAKGFPAISADVHVNAFVYSPSTMAVLGGIPVPVDSTTTTTTTTATTTTTSGGASAAPSSGAVASGAN